MSTVRIFQNLSTRPSCGPQSSILTRLGDAMKAAWQREPAKSSVADRTPAASGDVPLRVTAKIAAISTAGNLAFLQHNTGRPGVQGRWKASHRVPMP
ncbi:MAG: hypothetical protein IPP88_04935 [Betaproteobacteria bacterium]|nr:hypothetical protein [Betaproteobacteria bacterium]